MAQNVKEQNYLGASTLLIHLKLSAGQWIGDFGVGASAHFVVPVAKTVGQDGGVVLFDVLKSALSGASTRAKLAGVKNFKVVWTNLEVYAGAHGVADKTLDGGVLINVLHQSGRPKDILAEVHRMLKPGAKLLVADWKPEVTTTIAPPPERRLAQGHVEQLAQAVGFAPLERFDAGLHHWGLVVVRT